jgi:hypothetical protein
VSTEDQKTISPATQRTQALAFAEGEDFQVPEDYILGTDWHSLSVWESPSMERLKALIRSGAVHAIFMYDADRGPSKPAHRLLFRAMCEQFSVAVRCCHGQVPDGEMGEVMEFLSAWAKERQVHRAQQGSREGLRDRARLRGLPINGHAPYGYRLRYDLRHDISVPVAFEPDPKVYPTICRIWRLAQEGLAIRAISRKLVEEGIPAPKGGTAWGPATILRLLKNPVCGGRYYALRSKAVEPKWRYRPTYGKSSEVKRPEDEWIWIEDFPVLSPVVSWEEWEAMQDRLKQNKRWSRRNSHKVYLLAGMLFCSKDGWRFNVETKPDRIYHHYKCPRRYRNSIGEPNCNAPRLNGMRTDELVWESICSFLRDPHTFMAEIERQRGAKVSEESEIKHHIDTLQRNLRKVDEMESELVNLRLRGLVSDTAIERNAAYLRAERVHYQEEIERQQAALATVNRSSEALDNIESLRDAIIDRLQSTSMEARRWVLQTLDTRVMVHDSQLEISVGTPSHVIEAVKDFYVPTTEVA